MTKRRMFLRMVTASLLRRRSRMLIALLSIGVGATILSGLVTIYYDVPRQMQAQFRSYGANMLLLGDGEEALTQENVEKALEMFPENAVVGATPYRYVRLNLLPLKRQQSFTAAGTDFAQVRKTSPYFSVEGDYPDSSGQVMLGKEVADTIGAKIGSSIQLQYKSAGKTADEDQADASADWTAGAVLAGSAEGFGEELVKVEVTLDGDAKIASLSIDASTQTEDIGGNVAADKAFLDQFTGKALPLTMGKDVDALSGATVTSQAVVDAINSSRAAAGAEEEHIGYYSVTGILETGGEEEGYIFMSLEDLQRLTNDTTLDVTELSISADAEALEDYSSRISEAGLGISARLVKRVTRSEASVLGKLQGLVYLVTVVVLILTMVCVSTTMMAVVSERRREIGLRKALGAPDSSIRNEFLGEGMFLGGLGGVMGALLGFAFAQVVSVNVFGSSITFQPLLLPVTVAVSMLVAALSCLMPIRRAVAIDPALVLKGE